jgi:hypothetical protein
VFRYYGFIVLHLGMKKEYLNISKMSILTGISYDRINRAVRWGIVGVFSDEEKFQIVEASNSLLREHIDTHAEFAQMIFED